MKKICTILAMMALLFLTSTFVPNDSQARVGGGRSFGSRSSRSYSPPSRPTSTPSPSRQQTAAPQPAPNPAPAGGGFLRSLAGGVAGGLLGGMLFSALGGFGGGWGSGGGSGLLGILLIAGLGYLIFRWLRGRKQQQQDGFQPSGYAQEHNAGQLSPQEDLATALASIGQTDPAFDEKRFNEQAMDIFFKIQGAWMHRDLTPVAGILTEEMRNILQEDVARLLRDKQINRLENIAVRTVEITEAWQEPGQDYLTTRILANLLDYTVSDANDHISGSTTEPVKFEEFWTFTRPAGNNPWKLSAINQS
ncbi:MAG: Tim44 domain-containing protein [Desulfurivibrionaceae bacterium]